MTTVIKPLKAREKLLEIIDEFSLVDIYKENFPDKKDIPVHGELVRGNKPVLIFFSYPRDCSPVL